jgi:hypothetical protein
MKETLLDLAIQLVRIRGMDRKTFHAAIRAEFPGVTADALRKLHQEAKILLAIRSVTNQKKD